MAYIVMAYLVMAYIVMADMVMAQNSGDVSSICMRVSYCSLACLAARSLGPPSFIIPFVVILFGYGLYSYGPI